MRRLHPRPNDHILPSYYANSYYSYGGRSRSRYKQWLWESFRDLAVPAHAPTLRRVATALPRAIARQRLDVLVAIDQHSLPYVVDVGCGYGDLLLYFQQRGCQVLGVEMDERAAAAGAAYGIPIHVGHLSDMQLAAESVDVIVMQHSLEHMADPARAIRESARVLRPGGQIHIAVPNGDSAGLRVQGAAWGGMSHPLHLWYFDRRSLSRLLLDNGFSPIHTSYRTVWTFHYNWLRQSAGRGRRRALLGDLIRLVIARAVSPRTTADNLRVVAVRN